MENFLDVFFHIIHLTVIFINCTCWWSLRTLVLAQVTLTLTFLSWVVGGIFYGFGYCFLTDWHWQIKEKLGEKNLPASYLKYVLDGMSGRDINAESIDHVALSVLVISLLGCGFQTHRRRKIIARL